MSNTPQFTATAHSTVQDKQKFAAHFKKFIERGCPESLFQKWFYTRLSMCFGMIAHYNKEGFYNTFFTSTGRKLHFVRTCVDYPCYGDPAYTYSDVEKSLCAWLKETGIEGVLRETLEQEQEQFEIAARDSLIAKHGLPAYEIKREQA